MTSQIFKILSAAQWAEAQEAGVFTGAPVDLADGYIHLSTGSQVRETAARHFVGMGDLVLLWVDVEQVKAGLEWEPSRGGALFPHLYSDLPVSAVTRADPLPLDEHGDHIFPKDLPEEEATQ